MSQASATLVPGQVHGNTTAARPATVNQVLPGTEAHQDVQLVHRTLEGDHEAFAQLVEKYKDPVFNVAYRMLGNPTEAEDVAQEAFVRAFTQLRTYKDTHRFSTWLLSITSHLAIDQIRRRRFVATPLENVPFLEWIADVGVGPEKSALQSEMADEMQRILNTLPEKYRQVLVLRYWHDFSYDEIAGALHMTSALVKARLHRARELVARAMKNQGVEMSFTNEESHEPETSQKPQRSARKLGGPALAN